MSHHSDVEPDCDTQQESKSGAAEMFRSMIEEQLGATGKFPRGKVVNEDEGEIKMGVASLNGTIYINFGKPVAWIGFSKIEAEALIKTLQVHVDKQ